MVAQGLLADARNDSSSGRASTLRLNPDYGYVVGVEYTAHSIHLKIFSFDGTLILSSDADVEATTPTELLDNVVSAVKSIIKSNGLSEQHLLAVGAVDFGLIDVNTGVAIQSSQFTAWHDVNVREQLSSAFSVPVVVVGTAQARLKAVDRLEFCGKYNDIILLEYGAGIACGIKSGGNIVFGSRGMAGELGHTHVIGAEEPCTCGSIGCLEAVAALPALSRQTGQDGLKVLADAKAEDKLAMRYVHVAFERIGTALGNLVNVLNPDIVVLDPLLAEAGNLALAGLRRAMVQQMMPPHAEQLKVVVSTLPSPVPPVGGALFALDRASEEATKNR